MRYITLSFLELQNISRVNISNKVLEKQIALFLYFFYEIAINYNSQLQKFWKKIDVLANYAGLKVDSKKKHLQLKYRYNKDKHVCC